MFSIFHKIVSFQEKELRKVVEENKQGNQRSDIIMTHLSKYNTLQEGFKGIVLSLRKLVVESEEKDVAINK